MWLLLTCLWWPVDARADDQRALLSMTINQVDKGEVLVVLRGQDVLVGVRTLEELGVHAFTGTRESIGGQTFVSLASLAPRITFELDERALALRLSVQPELLDSVERNLASGRPDIEFRRDSSAFANYAINLRGANSYDVFTDLGFSTHGAFLGTTVSAVSDRPLTRGLTSATFDQRDDLRRIVVGDAFANSGVLGGGALLGGVTVSKEYSVDPYFVRYPTFSLSGAITTPSIAEVYVNGRLIGTEQLAPGQFALSQLPITTGRNDAHVVIRDAFGGVRELSASYYLTTTVLARGLHEYQYGLGVERAGFGVDSWSYGGPAFVARHRVGLTDSVTFGGRLEATSKLASGGPTVNVRTAVGEFEAAAAISGAKGADGGVGRAAAAGYTYSGHRFSAGGSARIMSSAYATTNVGPADDKTKLDSSAFLSVSTGPRGSLTLQFHNARMYLTPETTRTSLVSSTRLNSRTDMSLTASRERGSLGSTWEGFAGISIRVGTKTLASVSAERIDGSSQAVTEFQRWLPVGTGWGYRFHAENGDRNFASGNVAYQGPYGRYEARRDITDGIASTTVSVNGGLVAMNGGVYATRPIQDGYALIRVPDVSGVRAYVSNQEVGRTNKDGNLLVPNLLSYYGNILNISDQDVPLEHSVAAVRKTVAPPYRGGALVVFPVQRVQSAQGLIELAIDGETIAPAFGQLTVAAASGSVDSPIGERGEFYLENLAPGLHEASVQYGDTSCVFTLTMPNSTAPSVALGTLRCEVRP
jgi:outer membrane usher protein